MKNTVVNPHIAVLLNNLGTPEAPTAAAVRRYLAEFLSDPRVVDLPRWLWLPILYGIILPWRAPKSAKLYQKIWTPEGSPLRVITEQQAEKLQENLNKKYPGSHYQVFPAMRYGTPKLTAILEKLKAEKIQKILLLPLYPQYSATTTASVFDALTENLTSWRWLPAMRTINGYHDDAEYIEIIAASIKNYINNHYLLFSFHGLPKKLLLKGDPYYCFCHKTARLVAEKLGLKEDQWCLTFQSRLGKAEWLKPYTDETLRALPKQGIKNVAVVCPGFAADCLETLEEIKHYNEAIFKTAGGENYTYIPALNATDAHVDFLARLVKKHTQGW